MKDKNINQYTRKILKIAIPIMLSSLISQLEMLVDRMFLGRLDIKCMSAVGNASTPMWTTMDLIFTLTTGATILVSQAYGAGERDRARSITASMFKYNNALGVVLFLFWMFCPQIAFRLMGVDPSIMPMAVTYARVFSPIFILTGIGASISSMLQVSQKTTIMIAYGVVRSVVNIILDYGMIFGHFGFSAMGVKGAALATLIAELIGDTVILLYVLFSKEIWLKPKMNEIFDAKFDLFMQSIKLGIPSALEGFAWNFGNLYLIAMLNKVSIEAAGIHSIIFGIECVPIVLFGSIGNATLSLVGYETGGKNRDGVRGVVINSFIQCMILSAFNLLLFIIIPTQILGCFTADEAIIQAAPVYLLIIGVDLFPKAGNIIYGSGIKGRGEPMWMLKTQLFGTAFVIAASSVAVMVLGMGMAQLFCIVVMDEVIRFALNFYKFKYRWNEEPA